MGHRSCKDCIYLVIAKGKSESQTLVCTNRQDSKWTLYLAETCDLPCRNYQGVRIIDRPEVLQPADSEIRFIPLTQGKIAIVDKNNYEWLNSFKWHVCESNGRFYADHLARGKHIYMHRLIMEPPAGMVVDHKDGNGLNNTRGNLRICTVRQNICNAKGWGKYSKYKGVTRCKQTNKWLVQIVSHKKRKCIGRFESEIEGAKAYDKEAKELFGEYAHLNFPK